jgi:uncharacterized protein (TIGR03435 family)
MSLAVFIHSTWANALPALQHAGQTERAEAPNRIQFEAASIKPTDTGGAILRFIRVYPGGRLEIGGTDLEGLIYLAFQPFRVRGGGDRILQTRYDIIAVPPAETAPRITYAYSGSWIGDENLRQMLQSLLIHRFELRFHYEARKGEVYLLEKGPRAPAMQLSQSDPRLSSVRGRDPIYQKGGQWLLRGVTMAELAARLSAALEAPVLNHTGLNGAYDFTQSRTSTEGEQQLDFNMSFMNFFPELKLKLVKATDQIQTLVIDNVQLLLPN